MSDRYNRALSGPRHQVTMKLISLILGISVMFGASGAYGAAKPIPDPPALKASSYFLVDFDSGIVLAEKDPDKHIEPASITKLMTAYLVDKAIAEGDISLDEMVTISEKAWRMKGSKMFVEVGKQVSVEDLLKGLIIQSGNDASIALAEHVAGSESAFAGYMNHQAQLLGMTNTNFVNATGWPHENHYSSARDIATLTRAIIRDFPDSYRLYKEREYTFNKIRQFNRNRLLWRDDTVDGVKTGHTESAGYCLVASALRGDMRLVSVVIGEDSDKARTQSSQALLNYGFRFYETKRSKPRASGMANRNRYRWAWGGTSISRYRADATAISTRRWKSIAKFRRRSRLGSSSVKSVSGSTTSSSSANRSCRCSRSPRAA